MSAVSFFPKTDEADPVQEQWLHDLETLSRIERQRQEAGEPPGCFFTGMGQVIRDRMEGLT